MKVFKVERVNIAFRAVLSNGEERELLFFEPNMNQIQKMSGAKGVSENLEAMREVLGANVKGEGALEFIEDLYENGNVESFFENLNHAINSEREKKRKNS
ncbi:hypothetical protein BBW65_06995 [Helicobacter enhydrae]|uniref:Phage protein n=1 Tax=Helicobacter enhydrae TaxID=222136 RepID=A0A1B1U795_9HELI|nr:hypothetical protein [Helicobacter enhydrae]ANV98555.1 hypothetical protein BBW65_06995 [Helicobacter enhydrae]